MTQLIWLRSDLRTSDNTALASAMAAGPTVAVYLITPASGSPMTMPPARWTSGCATSSSWRAACRRSTCRC